MVRQTTLLTELQSIAGAENVRPGDDAFAVDGIAPLAVVRPATAEDAAAVIRHANATGLAVIPVGGKQRGGPGNVPARYDVALDMTALSTIVEYEPDDLTLTCGAGMTLGELRKAAAAAGQMVAFDPEIAGEATVGGALAADLWGPSRVSLGGPRDFTIGLRVITGDGLITRAGGRVVKNVAGYDLCKLYVGSLGTLAVITEATFKVQPLPRHARRIRGGCRTLDAGARFARWRQETGDRRQGRARGRWPDRRAHRRPAVGAAVAARRAGGGRAVPGVSDARRRAPAAER